MIDTDIYRYTYRYAPQTKCRWVGHYSCQLL